MPANVETTLELGLREAAEAVWARKVLLEALGPAAPFKVITLATHAHGKAVGRAEGTAFALELVTGDGVTGSDRLAAALADVGETVWDHDRLDLAGQHGALLVTLRAIPLEASWSAASTAASLRPLYPPTPRGPQQ